MRDFSELNINIGGRRVLRPAPPEASIQAYQKHFGIIIPNEYLGLLRYSNGGHPEADTIQPLGRPGATPWAVSRFFYLDDDKESLEGLWKMTEVWRRILGTEILPFASDAGGNVFFFDLKASPAAVKICVHDDNFLVVDIASSFETFIDGLFINPDLI